MSLEQTETVDAIGIEDDSRVAVLTIADSWDWTDEQSHLSALQEKLNAYLGFIESGQIWESYPSAEGRPLRIDVVFRFAPTPRALAFLAKAADTALALDVAVKHYTYGGSLGDAPQRQPAVPSNDWNSEPFRSNE